MSTGGFDLQGENRAQGSCLLCPLSTLLTFEEDMSLDQVNSEKLQHLAQGMGKLESLWKVLVYGQRNGDAQVIKMIMGRPHRRLYHKTVSRPYDKTRGRQRGWGRRQREGGWEEGIGGGMRAKGHCMPVNSWVPQRRGRACMGAQ